MPEPLIPQRFLFRFAAPCRYREPIWTPQGTGLDETYRLAGLATLEGRRQSAEVRAGWSEAGLGFWVGVTGKRQKPWCRDSRPDDSDGLHVWIDTRDVHDVHRASRFCHRLVFLPVGAGASHTQPVAQWLPINRARAQPRAFSADSLQVRSKLQKGGYTLEAFIAAEALTGFDPREYPRLGFAYAVLDRELGEQTFGVGSPMPYQEDPSLWATLELVR